MSARAASRLESLGFTQVFRYTAGKADWLAGGGRGEGRSAAQPVVGDRLRPDVPTCRLTERVGDVARRVHAAGWEQCIVVNDQRIVLGRLRDAALGAEPDLPAEEVMEAGPTTVRPSEPLGKLVERMERRNTPDILVTTADGELLGTFFRRDAAPDRGGRQDA